MKPGMSLAVENMSDRAICEQQLEILREILRILEGHGADGATLRVDSLEKINASRMPAERAELLSANALNPDKPPTPDDARHILRCFEASIDPRFFNRLMDFIQAAENDYADMRKLQAKLIKVTHESQNRLELLEASEKRVKELMEMILEMLCAPASAKVTP